MIEAEAIEIHLEDRTMTVEAPRIYPTFRYNEAEKMIDFLVEAFGFAVHVKYMDGGKVAHAAIDLRLIDDHAR